jgi:beta-lactamase regulating signal transducer with metallopeptidase domain
MIDSLLSNCFFAAILTLIVVAAGRWFRPSPATMHALWLLVMIKLISPIGLWWNVPLVSEPQSEMVQVKSREMPIPDITSVEVAYLPKSGPRIHDDTSSDICIGVVGTVADPPIVAPRRHFFKQVELPAESSSQTWSLLIFVWVVGAAVMLVRYGYSTWHFASIASTATRGPELVKKEMNSLASQLQIRPPLLRALQGLCSPMVWALNRPTLLWPNGLEKSLGADGRQSIVIHELAHLRRRDHWVRWLEIVTSIFHWWNPLFWLVRRQIRFHSELACDAWVTDLKPDSRRAYAEALIQVCSRSVRDSRPIPALGVDGEGQRDMKRRITMILHDENRSQLSRLNKLGILVLAIAFLPGWSFASDKDKNKTDVQEQKRNENLQVDFGFLFEVTDDSEKAKKIKELEAKLAEIVKQLAAMKGENQPLKLETRGLAKPMGLNTPKTGTIKEVEPKKVEVIEAVRGGKVIVVGADGKQITSEKVFQAQGDAKGTTKWIAVAPEGKQVRDVEIIVKQTPPTLKGKVESTKETPKPKDKPKTETKEIKGHIELVPDLGETVNRLTTRKGADNQVTILTRTTYKLPKEKATSLGKFLQENVKTSVLEMKTVDEGLVVTTTPEAQQTIGNLVALMLGKPLMSNPIRAQIATPVTIPTPVVPPTPKK